RRQLVGPSRGRLGPPCQRLRLAELDLQRPDPLLGLLGAPLRRARRQRRGRALVVQRLGPLAQGRQLGRALLGDPPRLVDRPAARPGPPPPPAAPRPAAGAVSPPSPSPPSGARRASWATSTAWRAWSAARPARSRCSRERSSSAAARSEARTRSSVSASTAPV